VTGVSGNREEFSALQTVLARLAGAGILLAGLFWIYLALFTAYRAAHRPVLGVFGFLAVLFSIGLFQRSRLCAAMLLAAAAGALAFSLLFQWWGGGFDPVLGAGGLLSAFYVAVFLPLLLGFPRKRRTM